MNPPSKGSVLVVDDEAGIRQLLGEIFEEQDYECRFAENIAAARAALSDGGVELVLLDVNIASASGYDFCRQLKAEPRFAKLPVLFITGHHQIAEKLKAYAAGGVDYITKPFAIEEVLARAETHLRLFRLQAALEEANRDLELKVAARTQELAELNTAYERFVPTEFLTHLKKTHIREVGLGDQIQCEMTFLFADIRGFTQLSENLSPEACFNFINRYLSRMSPIVRRHGGFVDKFIGDSIMALFYRGPESALDAAREMLLDVERQNAEAEGRKEPPLRIGIGIHHGKTTLGVVGETQRLQGTVISDAVNTASRLEGLTKTLGVEVVVSESVVTALPPGAPYRMRRLSETRVKGKSEPLSVYEALLK